MKISIIQPKTSNFNKSLPEKNMNREISFHGSFISKSQTEKVIAIRRNFTQARLEALRTEVSKAIQAYFEGLTQDLIKQGINPKDYQLDSLREIAKEIAQEHKLGEIHPFSVAYQAKRAGFNTSHSILVGGFKKATRNYTKSSTAVREYLNDLRKNLWLMDLSVEDCPPIFKQKLLKNILKTKKCKAREGTVREIARNLGFTFVPKKEACQTKASITIREALRQLKEEAEAQGITPEVRPYQFVSALSKEKNMRISDTSVRHIAKDLGIPIIKKCDEPSRPGTGLGRKKHLWNENDEFIPIIDKKALPPDQAAIEKEGEEKPERAAKEWLGEKYRYSLNGALDKTTGNLNAHTIFLRHYGLEGLEASGIKQLARDYFPEDSPAIGQKKVKEIIAERILALKKEFGVEGVV